jgi:DNA-directed RNA polymerase II subunit RPB1
MSAEDRWSIVWTTASKIKRCGEDTDDGCGCKQPSKIKKEGLSTIIAEWAEVTNETSNEKLQMTLTAEILLKCFKRISDDDVTFMGFSPIWSRPDWMICQVLAIPPPAVRPSVKHDSQQRSEDDVTHIIVNILKSNKTLLEKIQSNAPANVINDMSTVLQYYVATLVDNKIPGMAVVVQRSGRPLKSIKERLGGKHGRVRGNLMGKRVDYSGRSVITPDPNLSAEELGVPIRMAKNLTKPVLVNARNIKFLEKLVQNGPDVYPGAKILERKNGDNISLRYLDRASIKLELGDTVHRHMMDGDCVLFNRQPTLHRMSMMGHIVRIMPVGDTFRMNVADTKPYNADFDGDEMNLHMPQDVESETELRHLAAVPWQIISPANNKSIIGIFQDSLVGAYRLTRENIKFTPREAMNLLMSYNKVDIEQLPKKDISSFNLLSQILPPFTMKHKTGRFKDDKDEYKTSNNVLEITNGKYIRGQMEKGVLGDGTNGLIHRICNDFGNKASINFVDNLQNIVTEYMKTSGYSVGVSDLIANKATNDAISDVINKKKIEVKSLIDQTHLGIFENKTGQTDEQEFEIQVNNILSKAVNDAGKIGRESLNKDNRFVIMVNAGSKGSDLNISQMISCLGQQNVDNKRIPYGFENRTLPHFTKYDDSPSARGFVENSFISGLTPEELFFHAMGGRIGIIDTAVKTSQTGYIQRRLIKGLEDLKVEYDMTVRNNKNKIIQYSYGDDGFDPVKIEGQLIPIVQMTIEELYAHYQIPLANTTKSIKTKPDDIYTAAFTKPTVKRMSQQSDGLIKRTKELIDWALQARTGLVMNVFGQRDNKKVNLPVSFAHMINNIQGQQFINVNSLVDITPLEALDMIDEGYKRIESIFYCQPNALFKTMYYHYLTPKDLLMVKRYNKNALTILIDQVVMAYKKAIIAPGEMVGMIAAQSIGEPTTQMTLNTFHFAGVGSKSNVTRGLPRIEEIISLSENPKNPSCTIHLYKNEECDQENAKRMVNRLEHTQLRAIVESVKIYFDSSDKGDSEPLKMYNEFEKMLDGCNTSTEESSPSSGAENKSKWVIRMVLNTEEMLDRNITMDDVHYVINNAYSNQVTCTFSDFNSDQLVFRLRLNKSLASAKKTSLDQTDEIYLLKNFQEAMLDNLVIRGVKSIKKVIPRKIVDSLVMDDGSFTKKETWVLDTVGTNLMDLLSLDYIDSKRTYTNNIKEIYRVLGVEAARQSIMNEITEVIEFDSTYINYHHLSILCDRMTCNDDLVSIFRHGINNDDIGPIAKASFEETPERFLNAARHAELDTMRGVSANVMCGQEGYFGTSAFQVILDYDKITELKAEEVIIEDTEKIIESGLEGFLGVDEACSIGKLSIHSNVGNIKMSDMGADDGYELEL